MSSRFDRAYRVGGDTKFDAAFWNRIMRDLDTRIVGIEEKKADFEEAERTLLDLGLRRINETLLPAAEKIFRVTELGFLVASSDELATLVEGQNASLTIRAGDQRDLFTPSPFIALTRRSTTADYAIARTIAYDPESGILLFNVETVVGNGGPHNDWDAAALAGSVLAMVASLDETRSLRQAVADDRSAVVQLKADTIAEREAAETARTGAQTARTGAETARTGAEDALNSFLKVYRGASATPPANGEQGHFYFDTSLQQARVYTSTGWAPLFTVSLGGVRQGHVEAEAGQTVFTVAGGGFTFLNVFKNGVLLTAGEDYTVASPNFTLAAGAAEGDVIAYLAYFATDQTDFYTKETADGRFVRHDGTQELTPAQQGQARANIGADLLRGMRNKIINGGFDIGCRGLSFSSASSSRYTLDRWYQDTVGASMSVARTTLGAGTIEVIGGGADYCAQVTVASVTGAANRARLLQRIESVRTLAGVEATVSFWARGTASGSIALTLTQNFGTGGSPSTATVTHVGKVAVTTSWAQYKIKVAVPSVSGKTIGTNDNDFVALDFWFDAGSNYNSQTDNLGHQSGTFYITKVQVAEGDLTAEADPFEERLPAVEQTLCERYAEKIAGVFKFLKVSGASEGWFSAVPYRTTKRAAASFTNVTALSTTNATGDFANHGTADIRNTSFLFVVTTSAATAGASCRADYTAIADAEL